MTLERVGDQKALEQLANIPRPSQVDDWILFERYEGEMVKKRQGKEAFTQWKVAKAKVQVNDASADASLSFFDGLFMQLLNPKALVATLPIATIQFPSADITGAAIVFWSIILAILAFGAPTSYSLAGLMLGRQVSRPGVFNVFNKLMAILLVYVALMIAYEHVLTPLLA